MYNPETLFGNTGNFIYNLTTPNKSQVNDIEIRVRKSEYSKMSDSQFEKFIEALTNKANEILLDFRDKAEVSKKSRLINGCIAAHTTCPYGHKCEIKKGGGCHHSGIHHKVAYSCSVARSFEV